MSTPKRLYQDRIEKATAREYALPSRRIRVAASLPSVTAGEIIAALDAGLLADDFQWFCFEDGSQEGATFKAMRRAVTKIARKYEIRLGHFVFIEGKIEDELPRIAEELGIEFDYIFLDFCGMATRHRLGAIEKWDDFFSADCVVSATFWLTARTKEKDGLKYLLGAADFFGKVGAYYNGNSKVKSTERRALATQVGFCHVLPFAARVHSAWVYRHMIVISVRYDETRADRVRGLKLSIVPATTLGVIESWDSKNNLGLSMGEKSSLSGQLQGEKPINLKRGLSGGLKAGLRRGYETMLDIA